MALKKEKYSVNGIEFDSQAEAGKAQREWEGIQYVLKKNDISNPQIALILFNKLTEKQIFTTKIGIQFLENLKMQLVASEAIENKDILGYEEEERLRKEAEETERAERQKKRDLEEAEKRQQKKKADIERYKNKYYNSLILNAILIVTLIFFVFITLNSKNVNILNYENRLIDKYTAWELELTEWENDLRIREKQMVSP